AIYVYGWDRLAPRLHFLSGIPVAIAGVTGALFVISVNGWMNHPGGVRAPGRPRGRRAPVVGAVRQLLFLARVRAHVLRRLHRRWFPRRRRLRLGLFARTLGPV